jgi:TRIAD3 protein (E3 ubiquitin-protein ligase RNF216)
MVGFPYAPKPYLRTGREKHDPEPEAERQWLLQRQNASVTAHTQPLPDRINDGDGCEEWDDGIECGCCFSLYPFVCCFSCSPRKNFLTS